MDSRKVMEKKFLMMVLFLKVFILKEKKKMENLFLKMGIFIKEILKMSYMMAKEFINGKMEKFMKVFGKKEKFTVKEN